jgi:hypothetical protein
MIMLATKNYTVVPTITPIKQSSADEEQPEV